MMSRTLLFMLVVAAAPAIPAQQGNAPLRKSDLIRFLTGTAYSKSEVAGIVRRNCLGFVPSDRDRRDLRTLGATSEIFSAIDRCVAAGNNPKVAAGPPPAPRPVVLTISSGNIAATVGTVAYVQVSLMRGSSPVSGTQLLLTGASGIPGGTKSEPIATTDASGRATFAVPVGTRAGSYRLTVATTAGTRFDNQVVTMLARPASATIATLSPGHISLASRSASVDTIKATVTDAFGNAVPHDTLTLKPGSARTSVATLSAQTGSDGVATFALPIANLRDGDTLTLAAGTRKLAVLPVTASQLVAERMLEAERQAAGGGAGAEAAYDSVLSVDPGNTAALLGRGYLRSWAGKSNLATQDFQAAMKEGSDKAGAATGLGYNALRTGDYAGALQDFQQALSAAPGQAAAATGLAYAELWRRDRDQAARRAAALRNPQPASYPASAADQFRGGIIQLSERKFPDAVRSLSSATSGAPEWPEAYYNLALAYQADGQADKSAAAYRKYLQLRPDAADRADVSSRISALSRSPGTAFALGAIVPGGGQFYTKRPAFGVIAAAAAAGGVVWALKQTSITQTETFTDPFGHTYTQDVTFSKRKNLGTGLAVAGGVWLLSAIEAAIHAGSARGTPSLPMSLTPDNTSSDALLVWPEVGIGPHGPTFGAGVRIRLR